MQVSALIVNRWFRKSASPSRQLPMFVTLAAVALLVMAGCSSTETRGEGDSVAAGDAVSWRLASPSTWDDRVRVTDDPEGAEHLARQGIRSARLFEYLPYDTTIVPQTLLGVYVYDSLAWSKLEAEEGPPQGDLIARGPGLAYVVGFPQSNPFAPGSRDSAEFDRRSVSMEYVKQAFRTMP